MKQFSNTFQASRRSTVIKAVNCFPSRKDMTQAQIDIERKRFKHELQRISTMNKKFVAKMLQDFDRVTELQKMEV